MVEDFGVEAIHYNDKMIVLSPQLNDWGQTSANEAIALTEYFLKNYNIDTSHVYLHGMSGGGETGSLVMGTKPELFTAYLATSSQRDGDLYAAQGLTEDEINKLIVLDVRPAEFFTERGFRDQHSSGQAFAHEESVMGWLFGDHSL